VPPRRPGTRSEPAEWDIAWISRRWRKRKYTGVLAAADVITPSTTFWVMESIRLDLGFASYVHP